MVSTEKWFKSSYSGGAQNCLEVARSGEVQVRDTKDRDGGMLAIAPAAWRAFVLAVR